MKTSVKALVLTGYGLNCDYETAYAFELAGAHSDRVHINSLIDGSVNLTDYQIMVFGGGFSWGDDHGAGVLQATRMKMGLGDIIQSFIEKDNLILGICNGFQTLVNMGLLPGLETDYQTRCVALTDNDRGNFVDQWVSLKTNPDSPCVFSRGIDYIDMPVRHGEGKFIADEITISRIQNDNQVVFRYANSIMIELAGQKYPENPNGSFDDIAGICDSTGHILGLMPHPEAYLHWTNHPDWTFKKIHNLRSGKAETEGFITGLGLFENAVQYLK